MSATGVFLPTLCPRRQPTKRPRGFLSSETCQFNTKSRCRSTESDIESERSQCSRESTRQKRNKNFLARAIVGLLVVNIHGNQLKPIRLYRFRFLISRIDRSKIYVLTNSVFLNISFLHEIVKTLIRIIDMRGNSQSQCG